MPKQPKAKDSGQVVYLNEAYRLLREIAPEAGNLGILEVLKTILAVLEEKDSYTLEHSLRVAEYSAMIAQEMGLDKKEAFAVELSALLHDVGKIGVPDYILQKPGPLTRSEFEIMKSHPVRSTKIVQHIRALESLLPSILYHHERIDGYGYPDGLKGKDIPFWSKIVLVADTFDAMTSTRPYRLALDKEIAFEELKRFSGTQFDPEIVEAFLRGFTKNEKTSRSSSLIKKIA